MNIPATSASTSVGLCYDYRDTVTCAPTPDYKSRIAQLEQALRNIHATAHCISKAGPLTTPTLDDAWGKFDKIAVMATKALSK